MLFLFLFVTIAQVQTRLAGLSAAGPKLSCSAKRTEIVFPRVHDASGPVLFTELSDDDVRHSALLHVTLKWRRQKLEVVLYKNQVTSQQTHSEWSEGNLTYSLTSHRDCFYQGYVRKQRASYAAISTCNGLAGYIQTDQELLFIQPSSSGISPKDSHRLAHLLYTCEPKRNAVPEPEWTPVTTAHHMGRVRRSTEQAKYLEVLVAVDHSVVEEIGSKEKTQDYVMVLMNIANTVYQHHSLGQNIKVVVVKIVFLTKRQQKQVLTRNDPYRTVNKFCEWSMRRIPIGQAPHFDISVLLTKEVLGPSGYAPITGLCNPARSCAAVREEGFSTGFIIAHEMAHVFGVFHDGHGNNCHGSSYQNAMMAQVVESKLNHFYWSSCSKRRMQEMVRYLHCLNNKPDVVVEDHYAFDAPPDFSPELGRPYSLDFQCSMEFGRQFRLCPYMYGDPCYQLWCSSASEPGFCKTKRAPPMTGTSCGRERECLKQRCRYTGEMQPVNGNWGNWVAWTDCSTGCGTGLRQRSRVCDNPEPAFDGKKCEGIDSDWETCLNETCLSFTDKRAGECAVWDGLQIRHGTHKWMPFEAKDASSQCKQTCQSSYTREIVTINVDATDGVPCSYTGNNSNICREGECLTVGCDGILNSTKKQDMCGVCGGDGSTCKVVEGTFTRLPKSGEAYLSVLTLPSGARNIHIEETTRSAHFFALKDPRYGSYGLGGDKKQSAAVKFVYIGAMFEYKLSTSRHNESISSPGPIKHDIKVMLYPNRLVKEAAVLFRYTVPKDDFTLEKNKFAWKFKTWSQCSVTCGKGTQSIVHKCVDKDSGEQTDESQCKYLKAPRKDTVRCTREKCGRISYNFAMSNNFTACNATCGESGVQKQLYTCERADASDGTYTRVGLSACSHIEPPTIVRECRAPPCNRSVQYQWDVSEMWSECPCGEGSTQTRNVTCQKVTTENISEGKVETVEVADQALCEKLSEKPETRRPCEGVPCGPTFRWAVTENYGPCNASCGEAGKQTREIICEQVTTRKVSDKQDEITERSDDHLCADAQKPEAEAEPCVGDTCPTVTHFQWLVLDEWSDCPCGEDSTQTRNVTCQKVTTENKFGFKVQTVEDTDPSHCENLPEKPATKKSCQGLPCKPVFRWTATNNYSPCDAVCGQAGERTREIVCEQVTAASSPSHARDVTEPSDDHLCSEVKKPDAERKSCMGDPCPIVIHFRWLVSETWSDCPCGESSVQTRNVTCQKVSTENKSDQKVETVEETENVNCKNLSGKPATSRPCQGDPCGPIFRWTVTDSYSPCDAPCGQKGTQIRELACEQVTFRRTTHGREELIERSDDLFCADVRKPEADVKTCLSEPCPVTTHFQWLITGPWSECPCGVGNTQTRNVTCQKVTTENQPDGKLETVEETGNVNCANLSGKPATNRPCQGAPCDPTFRWVATKHYGPCDALCGLAGKQTREIICEQVTTPKGPSQDKDITEQADEHFCADLEKLEAESKACMGDPCPTVTHFRWLVSETWSDCPCGEGNVQTRNVTCQKVTTENKPGGDVETVEETGNVNCKNLSGKPATSRPCQGAPCEPTFRWVATKHYGPCDALCGLPGKQTREIICEQVTTPKGPSQDKDITEQADEHFCADLEKLEAESKACMGDPCPTVTHFRWLVSETWSDCPCGEGSVQTRNVTCQKVTTENKPGGDVETVEETENVNCKKTGKPPTSRTCQGDPCEPIFRWTVTDKFGPCEASCGQSGTQARELVCEQVTTRGSSKAGEVVERSDDHFCEQTRKPDIEKRACVGDPCPTTVTPKTYKWRATDKWGDCRAACGLTGFKDRLYTCQETTGSSRVSDVADDLCLDISKPEAESKPCEGPPCPLQWSIGFWSKCSVSCGTGKRYRKVHCGDPDTDSDDFLCKDDPPATSRKCTMRACPEMKDENCKDMYSFCPAYKALRYRCKRSRFRRKCCKTCLDAKRSAKRRKSSVRRRGKWRYYR